VVVTRAEWPIDSGSRAASGGAKARLLREVLRIGRKFVARLAAMMKDEYVTAVAALYDVPPWLIGDYRKPRFERLRWRLRRVWPIKAVSTGAAPTSWGAAQLAYEHEAVRMLWSRLGTRLAEGDEAIARELRDAAAERDRYLR
jgi:hypothetical protein